MNIPEEEIEKYAEAEKNYSGDAKCLNHIKSAMIDIAKWVRDHYESQSVSQPQWIDVKFKTLEWESDDFALTCDIIGVHYEIFDNIGGYFLRINYGETIKGKSIADCKQLAQGDFEAKCKSLLKPLSSE